MRMRRHAGRLSYAGCLSYAGTGNFQTAANYLGGGAVVIVWAGSTILYSNQSSSFTVTWPGPVP